MRQIVALAAISASRAWCSSATGSRSGLLGLGVLGIMLQTGPSGSGCPPRSSGMIVAGMLAVVADGAGERLGAHDPFQPGAR